MRIFRTIDREGIAAFFETAVSALREFFTTKEEATIVADSLNDLNTRASTALSIADNALSKANEAKSDADTALAAVTDAEKKCTTEAGHYTPSNGEQIKPTVLTTPFGQFISAIDVDSKGHITGVTVNPVDSSITTYDNSTGSEEDAETEEEAESDKPTFTKHGYFTFKFRSTNTQVTKSVSSVSVALLGTAGGMAGNLYDSLRISFVMDITPSDLATAMGVKTLEKQESFYFRPSNPKNKIIGKDVKKLDYPHRVTFYPDSSSTTMWVVIEGVFMWNVTNTDIETMLSDMDGYLCLRNNP